jgi:hypothetical protein
MTAALLAQLVLASMPTALLLERPVELAEPPRRELERPVMNGDGDGRRRARDVDRLGWYVPDFAKVQTGSFAGLVTVGGGYAAFNDILNVSALYGFTPASVAGESVHSISLLVDARPLELRWASFRLIPLYAGAGALITWGDGYFQELPSHYRDRTYYPATGRHLTAHLGIEASYAPEEESAFERHAAYFELTTLYTYLERWVANPETLGPEDALALGMGYRAAF